MFLFERDLEYRMFYYSHLECEISAYLGYKSFIYFYRHVDLVLFPFKT